MNSPAHIRTANQSLEIATLRRIPTNSPNSYQPVPLSAIPEPARRRSAPKSATPHLLASISIHSRFQFVPDNPCRRMHSLLSHVPEGRSESSPAFQRGVLENLRPPSAGGTTELRCTHETNRRKVCGEYGAYSPQKTRRINHQLQEARENSPTQRQDFTPPTPHPLASISVHSRFHVTQKPRRPKNPTSPHPRFAVRLSCSTSACTNPTPQAGESTHGQDSRLPPKDRRQPPQRPQIHRPAHISRQSPRPAQCPQGWRPRTRMPLAPRRSARKLLRLLTYPRKHRACYLQ